MFASWLTVLLLMLWARREVNAGRALFAAPRRRLGRLGRGHVLFAVAMAGVMIGLVWLMKADGAMLVAFGWPEVAALSTMIDLPALIDIAVIALVAAGQAGFGRVARAARPHPRQRRTLRSPTRRTPVNDDEGRLRRAA
ncbi:hypothetical protein [Sphingomonas sp. GC_Shp_3]|uniref:hypothetical protein n=1 Tax=Sphingomonas sp. GC_Shp_3 TaxID=2937383 RepID=UPI002269FF0C|nr:hypothetical protein [Sphingomonas sp. GC_Shp_3]